MIPEAREKIALFYDKAVLNIRIRRDVSVFPPINLIGYRWKVSFQCTLVAFVILIVLIPI